MSLTTLLYLNTYKMNIKTNLFEEYVNFVENTKKQNKHFEIIITLFVVILFFVLFKYLKE